MSQYFTNTTLSTSNVITTSNIYYPQASYYPNGEVWLTDPLLYGQPARVEEAAAIPEGDIAWLKRRVDEICWVPA